MQVMQGVRVIIFDDALDYARQRLRDTYLVTRMGVHVTAPR